MGTDPYTRAVSDVYQDLAGEGSYVGKGIYDPRVFHRALSGRLPEQLILSHDLIEGAHVRVGLASDIELLDDFPADYIAYSGRQHRWIRGDWQIARWCLPKIPGPDGKLIGNPLSVFQSLEDIRQPASQPGSRGGDCLPRVFLVQHHRLWGLMACATVVGFQFVISLVRQVAHLVDDSGPGRGPMSWRELGHDACAHGCLRLR